MGILKLIAKSLFGPQVDYAEMVLEGAIIVDVRSPEEFKMGHSINALNIPLSNLKSNIAQLKGKEVILVCQSGMRAASAKVILKSNGIQAHNAGSWTKLA